MKDKSILRHFNAFEWNDYVLEMKTKSPILYRILSKIVAHNDKRASRQLEHHFPGICTATAILLKERKI